MRTTRSPIVRLALAVLALAVMPARALEAQQEYPQSLYWGTGLIDIPVAPVSPITGDFAFSYMGKKFTNDPSAEKINYNNSINSQLTFSMAFFGRLEAGVAAFSSNPEQGFFGRATLFRQSDQMQSLARWLPSIAVGARNVGPYKHIDRFGCCYRLIPPGVGQPNATHRPSRLHDEFNTANTIYGVATEEFSLANIRSSWPDINFSVTAGYGNGLFKDDGGLGDAYAGHATGGLFYGVKSDFSPGRNVQVSLMAENNAWDYNVGGSVLYRGLRAGLYLTELAPGKKASGSDTTSLAEAALYNYSKVAFSIAWQSNLFALLHGDFLQNRAAELERQRQGLLAEIQKRQQRIAALELEINRYEAQNLLELEQRRAQAESELRQEREALRRLEDRLKRVEQQAPAMPPTTTPPPAGTPPTTPPPTTPPPTTSPTAR